MFAHLWNKGKLFIVKKKKKEKSTKPEFNSESSNSWEIYVKNMAHFKGLYIAIVLFYYK